MVKDREQGEEWDVVRKKGWEGWKEVVLGQAPVGTAFAPAAGQRFPIRQVFLVMT